MNSPLEINFLSVNQPIGTFYVTSIPAGKLLPIVQILRRGITAEEQQHVQRELNLNRKGQIAKYLEREDATFPTSIIIAANSDTIHHDKRKNKLIIGTEVTEVTESQNENVKYKPLLPGEYIGLVIDGQHRIEGLIDAGAMDINSSLYNFELPVVFMFDMSIEDMAEVFVVVNSTQRKVDSSLISDLFGLSTKRSPRKTCHTIAVALNSEDKGPFSQSLKMLGKKVLDSEILTQGSFTKYILTLISRTPDEDEKRLNSGGLPLADDPRCPLRKFFLEEKDEVIGKILKNYFQAIQINFGEEWSENPKNYLLRKTVGFSALIKVLYELLPNMLNVEKNVSLEAFNTIFKNAKINLGNDPFGLSKYSSSEAEARRMANNILNAIKTKPQEVVTS